MDISIIIPVLNEAELIEALIKSVRELPDWKVLQGEIIVVDGGSADQTIENAAKADKVIKSLPGRGLQQNIGANAASGSVLLFLHADCQLLPGSLVAALETLKQSDVIAGCFRQKIDASGWRFRILERGNNQRVQWLQWAYGDQGIYISRQQFVQFGQFEEIPFLEDWFLSRKLAKSGRIALSDVQIIVSARRWQKRGVIRQTLTNWTILLLALCGVSPARLAKLYQHIR